MVKNKAAKAKLVKKVERKVEKKLKKKKVAAAKKAAKDEWDGESFGPEEIQKLLEPYAKDQLIEFLVDAAVKDTSLFDRISEAADRDVSHRKIFIHGLGWDTTRETLVSSFESYGEIEECNVVMDRATGKAKGYGFVLFKERQGARKALKDPRKKINNRVTSCQLASVGPVPQQQSQDSTGRKIYVSNVQADADPEKLRLFFAKFGEIETGPIGFDMQTGKSRGFALFVYKTLEGARKVLEEPYKMFEGQQLHCQKAADGKNKVGASASVTTVVQPLPGPLLAAVAAAQNLALYSQHPSLNPVYSGLLANSNPGLISSASANPTVAGGGLGQGLLGSSQVGGGLVGSASTGLGGYGASASHGSASLGGPSSVLRAHGSGTSALKGLQHAYPNSQIGQSSAARGVVGAFSGYPSYMR